VDCFQCHASTPPTDANAPYRSAVNTGMKGSHL
jgi:hypothetical protein